MQIPVDEYSSTIFPTRFNPKSHSRDQPLYNSFKFSNGKFWFNLCVPLFSFHVYIYCTCSMVICYWGLQEIVSYEYLTPLQDIMITVLIVIIISYSAYLVWVLSIHVANAISVTQCSIKWS